MQNTNRFLSKIGAQGWAALALGPAIVLALLYMLRVIDAPTMGILYLAWFFLGVLPLTGRYWRGLDEPSQEANKVAAIYGYTWAMIIAVVFMLVFAWFHPAADLMEGWLDSLILPMSGFFERTPGSVGYILGLLSLVALQLVLGSAVWLGWWAKQRIGTKSD